MKISDLNHLFSVIESFIISCFTDRFTELNTIYMKNKKYNNRSAFKLKAFVFIAAFLAFTSISTRSVAQKKWVTPQAQKNVKNPLSNKTEVADGKVLYVANCAPCHGNKGRGDGPAAQALTPKPADHSSALVQSETDGSLFWKLSEGRNPMPSYKKILTDRQRWELVSYIRTLSRNH